MHSMRKLRHRAFPKLWDLGGLELLLNQVRFSICSLIRHCSTICAQASPVVLVVKNPLANAGRHKRCGFDPWVGKISWRRAWQPTPVFLPGESPWTEEPGGLHSMGSQSDLARTHGLWPCQEHAPDSGSSTLSALGEICKISNITVPVFSWYLTASQRGDGEGRGGVRISLFWSQVVKLSQELPYPQWVRQVPRSKTKTPASYLCKLFYPT